VTTQPNCNLINVALKADGVYTLQTAAKHIAGLRLDED
jgi:hypothetical protein